MPYRKKPVRKKPYKKRQNKKYKKKAYPSARGNMVPLAYNVETLHAELLPQTSAFGVVAEDANTPKNTKVYLPAMWERNTTAWNINGNWMTPCYINQKFRISFNNMVANHADSAKGFILRMHVVSLKITPSKFGARTDSLANFSADCEAQVLLQLRNSSMNSDFLEYSTRNRDIQIISTQEIRPSRDRSIVKQSVDDGTNEIFSAPPPVCKTVNHRVAKLKTRVALAPLSVRLPANLWVPCVVFTSDQLSANTGTFTIEHSSRTYYQDM